MGCNGESTKLELRKVGPLQKVTQKEARARASVMRKTISSMMTVNIWKSYMYIAVEETNIEATLAVMNTAKLVVEITPEKTWRPYWIWTHDLCNIGATANYKLT